MRAGFVGGKSSGQWQTLTTSDGELERTVIDEASLVSCGKF